MGDAMDYAPHSIEVYREGRMGIVCPLTESWQYTRDDCATFNVGDLFDKVLGHD